MQVKVYVFVVVGFDGQERSAVVGDTSDTICMGAYDNDGKYQHFESEAYHLNEWVAKYGFSQRRFETTVEV